MQAYRYPSAWSCCKEIYYTEGIKGISIFLDYYSYSTLILKIIPVSNEKLGFYKAIGPVLLTNSILRAISFTTYNTGKSILDPISDANELTGIKKLWFTSIISGSITGSVMALLSGKA